MKKSLLEIYALTVCFVAAIIVLTGLVMIVDDGAGLIAPEVMMNTFAHQQVANNDSYWQFHRSSEYNQETKSYPPRPAEDKLTAMRLQAQTDAEKEEQRTSLQGLIKNIAVTLVAALFFLIHWTIARRQREHSAAAA